MQSIKTTDSDYRRNTEWGVKIKEIEQGIFVDFNDLTLKNKFNKVREMEIFECPICDGYTQNCLMNDDGLQIFSEVFYCDTCEKYFTLQSYVIRSMILIEESEFA